MIYLVNLIKILLLELFSRLPDSPFSNMFTDANRDLFQYLNWFFPLDHAALMLSVWADCLIHYYIFRAVWAVAKRILNFGSVIKKFFK